MKKVLPLMLLGILPLVMLDAQARLGGFYQRGPATQEMKVEGFYATHPSIPINSRVNALNPQNGREIIVSIIGRIPPSVDRIIDLSPEAAEVLRIDPGDIVILTILASPGMEAREDMEANAAREEREQRIAKETREAFREELEVREAAVRETQAARDAAARDAQAAREAQAARDTAAVSEALRDALRKEQEAREALEARVARDEREREAREQRIARETREAFREELEAREAAAREAQAARDAAARKSAVNTPEEDPCPPQPNPPAVVPQPLPPPVASAPPARISPPPAVAQPSLPPPAASTTLVLTFPPPARSVEVEIIPRLPNPNDGKKYRLQAGTFSSQEAAVKTAFELNSLGFEVRVEYSDSLYRVVTTVILSDMVFPAVQRLGSLGFRQIIIHESN